MKYKWKKMLEEFLGRLFSGNVSLKWYKNTSGCRAT